MPTDRQLVYYNCPGQLRKRSGKASYLVRLAANASVESTRRVSSDDIRLRASGNESVCRRQRSTAKRHRRCQPVENTTAKSPFCKLDTGSKQTWRKLLQNEEYEYRIACSVTTAPIYWAQASVKLRRWVSSHYTNTASCPVAVFKFASLTDDN